MPPSPRSGPGHSPPAALARFLRRVGRLKTLPRTGWLDRGVSPAEAESVADHTFRVALLAWLAAHDADDPTLDPDRVLKLALVHDLAEAVTGDPTPYDPTALPADPNARRAFLDGRHRRDPTRAAAKRAAEDAAVADLLADLPPALAAELADLWRELVAGASPAARFVKQADKLETFLQSREYLAADPDRPMASFAAEVAEDVRHPALAALRDAISDRSDTEARPSAERAAGGPLPNPGEAP